MGDAITDTFVDTIVYWEPGVPDSTGATVYGEFMLVPFVRVDDSVSKEIRDLLQGKNVSITVWSLPQAAMAVGGWVCRLADGESIDPAHATLPQLVEGAKQIVNVSPVRSYDRAREYWRHVA